MNIKDFYYFCNRYDVLRICHGDFGEGFINHKGRADRN